MSKYTEFCAAMEPFGNLMSEKCKRLVSYRYRVAYALDAAGGRKVTEELMHEPLNDEEWEELSWFVASLR